MHFQGIQKVDLLTAELITKRITDGITYYDATIKATETNYSNLKKLISTIANMVATVAANKLM